MTINHLWVELPPITEAWQEVSVMHRQFRSSWLPIVKREESLSRLLKSVRTIVSLEEVFGPGLLNHVTTQKCCKCGEVKDDVMFRRQDTAYTHERENYIFACAPCFDEIQVDWGEQWKESGAR